MHLMYVKLTCHVVYGQTMMITSDKVDWRKQGTCVVVDNEPKPPSIEGFEAQKGWKELGSFAVSQGGDDYLFPRDQILRVTDRGYKVINAAKDRELGSLAKKDINYLVWYHHVITGATFKKHRAEQQELKVKGAKPGKKQRT
jgi:hypothetical protein